jgi:hypothetical protein
LSLLRGTLVTRTRLDRARGSWAPARRRVSSGLHASRNTTSARAVSAATAAGLALALAPVHTPLVTGGTNEGEQTAVTAGGRRCRRDRDPSPRGYARGPDPRAVVGECGAHCDLRHRRPRKLHGHVRLHATRRHERYRERLPDEHLTPRNRRVHHGIRLQHPVPRRRDGGALDLDGRRLRHDRRAAAAAGRRLRRLRERRAVRSVRHRGVHRRQLRGRRRAERGPRRRSFRDIRFRADGHRPRKPHPAGLPDHSLGAAGGGRGPGELRGPLPRLRRRRGR